MGADVSVGPETDKDVHAVKDVTGSSWVIDVNGQTKVVSQRTDPEHQGHAGAEADRGLRHACQPEGSAVLHVRECRTIEHVVDFADF